MNRRKPARGDAAGATGAHALGGASPSLSVRPAFSLTLAVLTLLLVVTLARNWDTAGWPVLRSVEETVQSLRAAYWHWVQARRDPVPGTRLTVPGRREQRPTATMDVVAFVESETSCCSGSVNSARSALAEAATRARVPGVLRCTIVLLSDNASGTPPDVRPATGEPLVVQHPKGRLVACYNPFFRPRLYLLGSGRLAWLQKNPSGNGPLPVEELTRAIRRLAGR